MAPLQRVGAYAICVDPSERILLSRYAQPDGRWVLPGGGVDHGESPEAAAVREVFEETGYVVAVTGLADVVSAVWSETGETSVHSINVIYACELLGGSLRAEKGGSSDLAAWIGIEDVSRIPHTDLVDQALTRSDLANRRR